MRARAALEPPRAPLRVQARVPEDEMRNLLAEDD